MEFNLEKSIERIDSIMDDSNTYDETDVIPKRDDLTYKNGKYVNSAAFFIDLRGSSNLIKTHRKKAKSLARIYRAYISEIVAILNNFETCGEISIVGDCVSAVFAGDASRNNESPIIHALQAASMSNGMMDILNVKYKKKWGEDFKDIKAGIGTAYGRALVIKAGFSGSGIKDLIYMGDVVNKASKMCSLAYKYYSLYPICVTEKIYESANFIANSETQKTFQDFLTKNNHPEHGIVYTGDFWRISMKNWAEENS